MWEKISVVARKSNLGPLATTTHDFQDLMGLKLAVLLNSIKVKCEGLELSHWWLKSEVLGSIPQ